MECTFGLFVGESPGDIVGGSPPLMEHESHLALDIGSWNVAHLILIGHDGPLHSVDGLLQSVFVVNDPLFCGTAAVEREDNFVVGIGGIRHLEYPAFVQSLAVPVHIGMNRKAHLMATEKGRERESKSRIVAVDILTFSRYCFFMASSAESVHFWISPTC